MLTWICEVEFNKIRQPTPPIIEKQDRRQLESIFEHMDQDKKGYCTAVDLSGGSNQDVMTKLKNIVDVETVRAVCGTKDIHPIDFLELMCEANYRAHADATRVICEDGNKIIQVTLPVVGFTGWLYEDVPKSEV